MNYCIVCTESKESRYFTQWGNCGHSFCTSCVRKLDKCAICRAERNGPLPTTSSAIGTQDHPCKICKKHFINTKPFRFEWVHHHQEENNLQQTTTNRTEEIYACIRCMEDARKLDNNSNIEDSQTMKDYLSELLRYKT